jgi:hypothetical protein
VGLWDVNNRLVWLWHNILVFIGCSWPIGCSAHNCHKLNSDCDQNVPTSLLAFDCVRQAASTLGRKNADTKPLEGFMAIYRLIANGSFGPDEIKVMTAAYEAALIDLSIANRDDPITELVAKAIVNVVATGERDPTVTKERALNALGVRRPAA